MYDLILSRRSIRKYKNAPVSREQLEKLTKAGMYSATAMDLQPFHFVVVDDRETLSQLKKVSPYVAMLETAPACILVCGDSERSPDYYLDDCAAASQNILLAAASLGLGSCWCALYPREERMMEARKLLHIPEHIIPYSLIPVGYADEEKLFPKRDIDTHTHFGRW